VAETPEALEAAVAAAMGKRELLTQLELDDYAGFLQETVRGGGGELRGGQHTETHSLEPLERGNVGKRKLLTQLELDDYAAFLQKTVRRGRRVGT
jgi:hypothetical protein